MRVRVPRCLRLHGDGGFTTLELLLASVLSIAVLGAVFTLSDLVGNRSVANSSVTQAEDTLRIQMDQLVRTVRDAPPAGATTSPLVLARSHDFIVASSQVTNGWVRYCVGGADGTGTGTGALRIGRMTGAFVDPGVSCPAGVSGAWSYQTVIASGLRNPDSLFAYDACPNLAVAGCTVASVRSIGVLMDVAVTSGRGNIRLNGAVTMRNRT